MSPLVRGLLLTVLAAGLSASEPYLRITPVPAIGTDCLEVAVRSFEVGDSGRRVQLVAVSHVGTEAYYQGLQGLLNRAGLVLYEGIDGDDPGFRAPPADKKTDGPSLQRDLARALGLVFQLDLIDYSPSHFINSDLSSAELLTVFEGGEIGEEEIETQARIENLMDTMEQKSVSGQTGAAALEFLQGRPGWSRAMRWAMVQILGSVRGDMTSYVGMPEHMRSWMEVLLTRRNEVVMEDLRRYLEETEPGETVAVFYGAAHMHEIHDRLVNEMDAVEVSVEWRPAFCGYLQRSGLNLLQKQSVKWFVARQVHTLELMSGMSAGEDSD
jgi:hypothetical protein